MITEREAPQSKLARLHYDDGGSVESVGGGSNGNGSESMSVIESPVDCRTAFSSKSLAQMKRESRSSVCTVVDEDSNSDSNLAIDVHSCNSDPNTPTSTPKSNSVPLNWATDDLLHPVLPGSLDLAAQIKRKEVFNARKQREFIPDNKKDESYWDRRRRNNEAAKRSREKRRLNDMVLETRVIELTKENTFLKTQLMAIRDQFGIIGENLVNPDQVSNVFQQQSEANHHHQVALNLSKRAKLLTPIMGPTGVVHSPQTAAVSMMAAAAAVSNPGPPVAALRSLVMASALQQQQQQQKQPQKVNGRHPVNGKNIMSENGGRGSDSRTNGGVMRISNNNNNSNGGVDGAHNSPYGEYWNLGDGKYHHSNQNGNSRGPTSAYHQHIQQQTPSPMQQSPPPPHHHQFVVPNGHHNVEHNNHHQGALLSALNGNGSPHDSNGYSRYSDRYSPPYSNGGQHQMQMEFSSRSNHPMAAHQSSNNRHGYAHNGNAYRQHPHIIHSNRLPSEMSGVHRNGDSHGSHYDDSCSNCSSSGDEGGEIRASCVSNGDSNNGRSSSRASPSSPFDTVIVDVDHYPNSTNGRAVTPVINDSNIIGDPQLHLPHKLRHKPRLSECSAPALSPPSRISPPIGNTELHSDGRVSSFSSSTSGDSPCARGGIDNAMSCDERDDASPDVHMSKRKRKASVFVAVTSTDGDVVRLRPNNHPLETENTQLKMEMQRLAIEVASLKDMLFCKKSDMGASDGNGSTKSDASSGDSGCITEIDKDDELSSG
ncbi:hypothetical protein CHUAL_010905 [Chamberlinius hualienensis]